MRTASAVQRTGEEIVPNGDEALKRRGLEHLQAGEWDAAVECLSELVERHPDEEQYANLLTQARVKARLGDQVPRRRKGRSVLHSRPVWIITLLNLMLWLVVFGQQVYQQQLMPALQQRQALAHRQELLAQGRQLLVTGELSQAAAYFNQVLTQDPDNAAARQALEETARRQQLAQTYDRALALIKQEDWEGALEALEAIRQEDPSFRDVVQQIDRVHKMREPATAFQQANELFQSGDWRQAVEQLLVLQAEAPDYRPATVKNLLVESYMQQADAAISELVQNTTRDIEQLQQAIGSLSDLVQSTTRDIEQLQTAIGLFNKALEVDPTNAEVARQVELAQAYVAGVEAYRHGNWEGASIHLAGIYPVAPVYAEGRAALLLQATYVQNGRRYARKEEYERAAEKYRQAIALGLTGDARPVPDSAGVMLQTADSLVRQGRYQEAAAIYGNILSMMGFGQIVGSIDKPKDDELAWQRPPAVITTPINETAETAEPTPPPFEVYVVRPNDTLSQIAQRFNTSVAALLEANGVIQNPNLIRPGWRLLLPLSR